MNDRFLEFSEARVDQERDHFVQAAQSAVSGAGASECEDCGEPISDARRAAAPFAKRCLECQSASEREARLYAR